MKHFFLFGLLAIATVVSVSVPAAYASVTPTLSVAATGSGDNVEVNVTGDPNVSVLLSYNKLGVGLTIASLGTTNSSGSFSSVISSAQYGITSGTLVTALLNGTAGARSSAVTWPTVTSANALSLSQNALVINTGASNTISASNTGGDALYVSNNSNPSIANVGISGTTITISGNTTGSTAVTICTVGNTSNCPVVYVTVQNAGSGQLSFSQSSATVVAGQNLPITISGGNGTYRLEHNSDAATVQASLSGSVLTLSTGSTSGSASITICSTDSAACGVVQATVGNASSINVSFSNSAPVVSTNQSADVAIYGPSGVTFYVASNSNPSVVQANLSGTTLTLTGITAGTSAISVCASTGSCSSLTTTVQYAAATAKNISLSQNTLSLAAGQNGTITISGGQQPYTVTGGISSVSQQTISGNTLTVYGVAAGTSSIFVCSSGGGCTGLKITVNGSSSNGGTTTNSGSGFSISQNSISLAPGKTSTLYLSGGSGYYLSANNNKSVAAVAVSGSSVIVSGVSSGTALATICQSSGAACITLSISVTSTSGSTTSTASSYRFTSYLHPGLDNNEVLQLQNVLAALGYLTVTPTGYYGTKTTNAVVAFQAAHGIDQLGVVGPATRAALNKLGATNTGTTASGSSSSAIQNMSLAELKAEVQKLQSLLTEALNRISQLSGN